MAGDKPVIKVGSRRSQLALWQTNFIIGKLTELFPDLRFEVVQISTLGDHILDTALSKIGEKSMFTKELEVALEKKEVDFVVHSLKDLPTVLPSGLVIGCVYKRDSPLDAVVMHPKHGDETLATLPPDSVIGTSSLRRVSQLKKRFPHLKFEDVRGNLNTRFRRLDDDNKYDALILAAAGLDRMGWSDRISQTLDPDTCMYSVSQGAMSVECRTDDTETLTLISQLHHYETTVRCVAERAFLKTLEGGCSVPVCVHTELVDNKLMLRGGVYNIEGSESVIQTLSVDLPQDDGATDQKQARNDREFASIVANGHPIDAVAAAEKLGIDLAKSVITSGGGEILKTTKIIMAAAILEEKAKKEVAKRGDVTAATAAS